MRGFAPVDKPTVGYPLFPLPSTHQLLIEELVAQAKEWNRVYKNTPNHHDDVKSRIALSEAVHRLVEHEKEVVAKLIKLMGPR